MFVVSAIRDMRSAMILRSESTVFSGLDSPQSNGRLLANVVKARFLPFFNIINFHLETSLLLEKSLDSIPSVCAYSAARKSTRSESR